MIYKKNFVTLNEINLSILDKSDEILLVLSNNLFDIKNMKNLISIFRDLDKSNYRLLLNESIDQNSGYFNMYDIKDIIKANIDYVLSDKFYIKDIDNYIMNGNIVTLNNKLINSKDYKVLDNIVLDITEDNHE